MWGEEIPLYVKVGFLLLLLNSLSLTFNILTMFWSNLLWDVLSWGPLNFLFMIPYLSHVLVIFQLLFL